MLLYDEDTPPRKNLGPAEANLGLYWEGIGGVHLGVSLLCMFIEQSTCLIEMPKTPLFNENARVKNKQQPKHTQTSIPVPAHPNRNKFLDFSHASNTLCCDSVRGLMSNRCSVPIGLRLICLVDKLANVGCFLLFTGILEFVEFSVRVMLLHVVQAILEPLRKFVLIVTYL